MKILPVTDRAADYANELSKQLDEAGFRVEVDHRNEKIGKKIREATMEKIPYMLVVGDRDMENHTVSVRLRSEVFAGFHTDVGLYAWYEIANFFILPSRYEPFGAVINLSLIHI